MLSQSSLHVLRALRVLAATGTPREGLPGGEIARRAGLPRRYLSKILNRVARAGLLRARRGAGGGYRLARPAADIRLAEIILPFENGLLRSACLLGDARPCPGRNPCRIHGAWRRVRETMREFLENTTLSGLAGPSPARRRRRAR